MQFDALWAVCGNGARQNECALDWSKGGGGVGNHGATSESSVTLLQHYFTHPTSRKHHCASACEVEAPLTVRTAHQCARVCVLQALGRETQMRRLVSTW